MLIKRCNFTIPHGTTDGHGFANPETVAYGGARQTNASELPPFA